MHKHIQFLPWLIAELLRALHTQPAARRTCILLRSSRSPTKHTKQTFRKEVTRVSARLTVLGMNPGLLPIHLHRRNNPRIDSAMQTGAFLCRWPHPSPQQAAPPRLQTFANAGSRLLISDLARSSEQNLFGEWRHALLQRPNLQCQDVPSAENCNSATTA